MKAAPEAGNCLFYCSFYSSSSYFGVIIHYREEMRIVCVCASGGAVDSFQFQQPNE
jgi:hypothetical protein